jgi:hypothetical protein
MMVVEPSLSTFSGFSPSVAVNFGYYACYLKDSDTGKEFYVGKGKGSRIFSHPAATISSPVESNMLRPPNAMQTRMLSSWQTRDWKPIEMAELNQFKKVMPEMTAYCLP